METFPRYWPFVQGIHRVPGEFRTQRPVTRSFDVFFDLRLNKPLSIQWGWWFQTLSRSLWRNSNVLRGAKTVKCNVPGLLSSRRLEQFGREIRYRCLFVWIESSTIKSQSISLESNQALVRWTIPFLFSDICNSKDDFLPHSYFAHLGCWLVSSRTPHWKGRKYRSHNLS